MRDLKNYIFKSPSALNSRKVNSIQKQSKQHIIEKEINIIAYDDINPAQTARYRVYNISPSALSARHGCPFL